MIVAFKTADAFEETYHQRSIVESVFSLFKYRFTAMIWTMTLQTQKLHLPLDGYAVMPPRPGLATHGSPISWMIPGIVFGMRLGRYCWTKSWCG